MLKVWGGGINESIPLAIMTRKKKIVEFLREYYFLILYFSLFSYINFCGLNGIVMTYSK